MALQRPLRFVSILISLASTVYHGIANNTSFQDNALSTISAHCQQIEYCGRKVGTATSERKIDEGLNQPCCTVCSCDDDCQDKGTCCFSANGTQSYPPFQRCYSPSIRMTEAAANRYMTYHMVDQCPDPGHPNANCGKTKVNPWGSMMPVYSALRGMIYKNIECARCHDVVDAEVWLAYLTCKAHKVTPGSATAIVAGIEALKSGNVGNGCHVSFTPPDTVNSADIQTHECFNVRISQCNKGEEFDVPHWSGLTKQKIIENCESGIWSPYIYTDVFKNIFCFICNNDYNKDRFPPEIWCHRRIPFSGKTFGLGTFTGFINMLSWNKLYEDKGSSFKNLFQTCKISDAPVCRQVYCPVGQLYNRHGTCTYPFSAWYASSYNLHLTLIPKEKNRIADMPLDVNILAYSIKTPLSNAWILKSFHYQLKANTHDSDNDIVWFLVFFKRQQTIDNVSAHFIRLEKLLKEPWVITYGWYQYTCHAEFSRYIYYHYPFYGEITPYWKFLVPENQTFSIPHERGAIIPLLKTHGLITGVNINRLNFCQHIQLHKNEFIYIQDVIVRDIDSGKYFFENEYIDVLDHNGYPAIRVCQEDLGFSVQSTQRKSGAAETNTYGITIIVLVILTHCH